MSVLTGDTRLEDAQNAYTEGGVTSMGERFLDQAEARGEIKAYVKLGWDINKIAAETKIPQKEVESIIDSIKKKEN